MYTIGFDIGSSSVKAAVVDPLQGKTLAVASYPDEEMFIDAPYPGWAEQDPEMWWGAVQHAASRVLAKGNITGKEIGAVGLSYQMHGLVLMDAADHILRPAIIWCDSRAVENGTALLRRAGKDYCYEHLLNAPGNFTAAKLAWVKENEPALFSKAVVMLLPGDYIAFRLTGKKSTTVTGLSEGILWDFYADQPAYALLQQAALPVHLLPPEIPVFGSQGALSKAASQALGLSEGTPVTYRAGDQPNNAFSLNVLQPGEVAATAGTSGVVYGVTDKMISDRTSRVNAFAHVNHQTDNPRIGVLLCINGTGIQYAWIRKQVARGLSYEEMNREAGKVAAGADGLLVYPFGNGAERMLQNSMPGAAVLHLDFNRHTRAHLIRAAQEGIAFSMANGIGVLNELGLHPAVIRAGYANMFLSTVFARTLATVAGIPVELYNTDGATGAAMGAALGAGIVESADQLFGNLSVVQSITPEEDNRLSEAYETWKSRLEDLT